MIDEKVWQSRVAAFWDANREKATLDPLPRESESIA